MKGLLEIMTTKMWMVELDFAHSARKLMESNFSSHNFFHAEKSCNRQFAVKNKENEESVDFLEYQVSEGGKVSCRCELEDMEVPFVNVMKIDGPITRHGGACSFGSLEHRDWMIKVANNSLCVGHVLVIDSPGGSSWSKNDFKYAIDYAHSMGQKVIAFVDGMCASLALYVASMCDEVFYTNEKDQLGSVGVMAAFYTQKDGSKNVYSDETYHEIYDPESVDKNRMVRDIANDDNDELLVKELAELGQEFRADMLKSFPSATEDHLKGKLFYASEVEGIFCNGKSTLSDVVNRVFELNGKPNGVEPEDPEKKPVESPDDAGSDSSEETSYQVHVSGIAEEPSHGESDDHAATSSEENTESSLNTISIMDYKNVAKALSAEAVASEENGDFRLTSANMDSLETTLSLANANIEAANARIAELEAENKRLDAELKSANQTIQDRDETIVALTNAPAAIGGSSPSNNGIGAKENEEVLIPKYDESLSPIENKRIRDAFFAKLKR